MKTLFNSQLFLFFRKISCEAKIENMGRNDQNNRKWEQNQLIIVPMLLGKQQNHPRDKKQKWHGTTMMAEKTMAQRINTYGPGQQNHSGFKPEIMDNVNAENGQTC
jgi:hypothetical protein